MSTTPASLNDWLNDAAKALQNDQALVDATNADAAASASTLALGFLAQIAALGAPILSGLIATAVGGPGATATAVAEGKVLGDLAAASLTTLANTLTAEHANALAPLTPEQQALATSVLTTGAAILTDKLTPKA